MKNKKLLIVLICLFFILLGTTLFVSFSTTLQEDEILIQSITPIYDETSGVVVDDNGVTFNDKNQVVKYNVVLENTQNYDVKISDIKLSTPTEEFLDYKVDGVKTDDVISANSTKELVVSFETTGIKGWGRNFTDELTANISFEKVAKQEEQTPPTEDDKEEEKQPEAPATNIEELTSKTEKIEVISITENDIEFKIDIKVEDGDEVSAWLYPETEFLGYNEIEVSENTTKIIGIVESIKKAKAKVGEHNIALVTEENETLGYINVYVDENKEVLKEIPRDTTNKEESNTEGNVANKPSTDSNDKEENAKDDENKVENPYTSDNGLVIVLGIATAITGVSVIILSKNKFARYSVLVMLLSSTLSPIKAEQSIELPIRFNVSFESQNVMDAAYTLEEEIEMCWEECDYFLEKIWGHFWVYKRKIKNIYFENEITEIDEFEYEYDVTEAQNGRVKAYLVENKDDSSYYDLYLQADGIIYLNEDASYYFAEMDNLEYINNLDGIDTSNVTNMSGMFLDTGRSNPNFTLDVSGFDTRNVTDMSSMFLDTGRSNPNFTLDVSGFDTRNVTDMSSMFNWTGYNNTTFTLDVSNFDTSKVINMSNMFAMTGYNSTTFTLDVSNFDTSKVINMSHMFSMTGYNSTTFTLDVSNFDTSNVTDMNNMFYATGFNSTKLNTSITISNPNTTSYQNMFSNVATKEGSQIKVNYTAETDIIVNSMIATKTRDANVVRGDCIGCVGNYVVIGTEININGEKFNVISQTDDTITMFAQYNLGTDYRQSTTANRVAFAYSTGWEHAPGPKEIDIQEEWSSFPKIYVNEYVEYLKTELADVSVTGDLITLKELKALGCTIQDDYSYTGNENCENSRYKLWLINNQNWWTRSADSTSSTYVWRVDADGYLYRAHYCITTYGVRPVITISKEALKNYLKTS